VISLISFITSSAVARKLGLVVAVAADEDDVAACCAVRGRQGKSNRTETVQTQQNFTGMRIETQNSRTAMRSPEDGESCKLLRLLRLRRRRKLASFPVFRIRNILVIYYNVNTRGFRPERSP